MPKLATKESCTGCTACASICPKGCISMAVDEHGFPYPEIDTGKCVGCGLCGKTCPIINPAKNEGDEPVAYAAYSKDEAARVASSSGGVFTEIAKAIIVCGGAVFGAAYNERFEVAHICVENEAEVAKLRGAKYAQSDLLGIFSQVKLRLDRGQKVLFSGTPCQVGGLKAFLQRDYAELLTVDFVCHSVPSPAAWSAYVRFRAEQDNNGELPLEINLRSKRTGWSRYQYSNLFVYENEASHIASSAESLYMKLLVGGCINRQSCLNCRFKGYSRVSDLTLGDFWGIWDIAPEMDDDKGTSLVITRSERGAAMFERISDQLIIKQMPLKDVSRQNQALLVSVRPNTGRKIALDLICAEGSGAFNHIADLVQLSPSTGGGSFVERILRKIGVLR